MTQVGDVAGIQIMQTVQVAAEGPTGWPARTTSPTCVGAVVAGLGIVTAGFVRRSGGDEPDRPVGPTTPRRPASCRPLGGRYSVIAWIRAATSAATGPARRLLHGHELGHVALHLDLAGHERLHPGRGLPSTMIALAVA